MAQIFSWSPLLAEPASLRSSAIAHDDILRAVQPPSPFAPASERSDADSTEAAPEMMDVLTPPTSDISLPTQEYEGGAKDTTTSIHSATATAVLDEREQRNVYFASLPNTFSDQELHALASPCGFVVTARFVPAAHNGVHYVCRGYGFVLYADAAGANAAVANLHGTFVDGRRIQVRLAKKTDATATATKKKMMPAAVRPPAPPYQQAIQALPPPPPVVGAIGQPYYVVYAPPPVQAQPQYVILPSTVSQPVQGSFYPSPQQHPTSTPIYYVVQQQ